MELHGGDRQTTVLPLYKKFFPPQKYHVNRASLKGICKVEFTGACRHPDLSDHDDDDDDHHLERYLRHPFPLKAVVWHLSPVLL